MPLLGSGYAGAVATLRLPDEARKLVESSALGHLVTLSPDGSPQVSCIWVGLDDDEIVSGHLNPAQRKLQNIARDPRVALSIEGTEIQPPGLMQYLVVHGRARLVEGGAADLLQRARLRLPRPRRQRSRPWTIPRPDRSSALAWSASAASGRGRRDDSGEGLSGFAGAHHRSLVRHRRGLCAATSARRMEPRSRRATSRPAR